MKNFFTTLAAVCLFLISNLSFAQENVIVKFQTRGGTRTNADMPNSVIYMFKVAGLDSDADVKAWNKKAKTFKGVEDIFVHVALKEGVRTAELTIPAKSDVSYIKSFLEFMNVGKVEIDGDLIATKDLVTYINRLNDINNVK